MTTQLKITQATKRNFEKKTVDSFIDKLVKFEETVISNGSYFLSAQQVYNMSLNLEIYRQLN